MAGPFYETFNVGSQTSWNVDQSWTGVGAGHPDILFTKASTTSVGTTVIAYVAGQEASSANNEVRVYADQMTLSTNSIVGVLGRVAAFGDSYYEFLRVGGATLGSFTVALRRIKSGVLTTLTSATVPRAALATPELLKMTITGGTFAPSTITCYLNGVQVLGFSDAIADGIATGTRGGMSLRGSASLDTFADNWGFGDIGTTGEARILTGKGATSDSAKATYKVKKGYSTKVAIASKAKAAVKVLKQHSTKVSSASNIKADLSTLSEGFNVARGLVSKSATASKAKATLTTSNIPTEFIAKVSTVSNAKASRLNIVKTLIGTAATSSEAKATQLARTVRVDGKMFQTVNITARSFAGRVGLIGNIPTSSSAAAQMSGGRVSFSVYVPLGAFEAFGGEYTLPPVPIFVFQFRCPADLENPPDYPYPHPGNRLFRHYRSRPAGRNVYIYSNNQVSENDPDGYTTIWRESDRTSDTLPNAAHVVKVFWGGHDPEPITAAQRTLLENAGYQVELIPV